LNRVSIALVVAAIVAMSYTYWPGSQPPGYFLEVTRHDSASGERVDKIPLRDGAYVNLQFSLSAGTQQLSDLARVRVVDRAGTLLRSIPPQQIRAAERAELSERDAAANRQVLILELRPPMVLRTYAQPSARTLLRRFTISFVVGLGLGLLVSRWVSRASSLFAHRRKQLAQWLRERPGRLVVVVSAAAVILSCYPIVFFGKSFLSPNNHSSTFLLYGEMPTVPEDAEVDTDNESGSDLGAAMWYTWPVSRVAHRAIFHDFQLPLWNRYDSLGVPLLGQGQSMLGDPLQLIPLLTNGAAGAWDLKYLLAKFLFASSLGFCVLILTRHIPSALIIASVAPFIGFFSYRYSHPAFFSLCYAPLILLCWIYLGEASRRRRAVIWAGLMCVANWLVMTSGTVKEAYILLLAMNGAGCLTLLLTQGVPDKIRKLRQALCVQGLFILVSASVWLTFLTALRGASTFYNDLGAYQIQPGLLLGLFDDIFYRQFTLDENHLDPSLNFAVLAAIIWLCFSSRAERSDGRLRGLIVTCVLSLAFVFGVVPGGLIGRLPFLGQIHHIDNTFSCIAIVCLLVLAGPGVKAFWQDCQTPRFRAIYPRFLLLLVILFALYLGTTEAAQRSKFAFLRFGQHVPKSPFFWGYSVTLLLAVAFLPVVARLAILGARLRSVQSFSALLLVVLLLWRQGMHLSTPFDDYVMNPHRRVELGAESSRALKLIKSRAGEPFRTAGLGDNFAPGYGGAVGLEQIDSADPLLNPYYRKLIDNFALKLPFASSGPGVLGEDLQNDVPLLDMLNVRFYLGSATKPDLAPSVKRIAALDLDVYESSTVWPRAFFTNQVTSYRSESEFVSLFKSGDGRPFAAIPEMELQTRAELRPLLDGSTPAPGRKIVAATNQQYDLIRPGCPRPRNIGSDRALRKR
jgi:hypothetical protein